MIRRPGPALHLNGALFPPVVTAFPSQQFLNLQKSQFPLPQSSFETLFLQSTRQPGSSAQSLLPSFIRLLSNI